MDNEYLAIKKTIAKLAPRIELSKLSLDDEQNFFLLSTNSKPIHNPWTFPPINPAEFKEIFSRTLKHNFISLAVRSKGDSKIIGIFNLSQIFYHNFQNTILGCYANIAYHKQGYMREALLHTVGYAFFELKLHRIEANIICENERSKKLFTSFGFRPEGMSKNYLYINGAWRDHYKYALTREDWDKVLSDYA